LSDLKITQALDDDRPNDQSGKERSDARESGAKSEITENAERRKIMEELQI